jgi:pimeloyl-ACP methyl ester carboxylesterase
VGHNPIGVAIVAGLPYQGHLTMAHANVGEDGEEREHRVVANGLEHRVLEWTRGTPTGTALLLHGYMDAAATWRPVACRLARAGLRVIAPDLRGYGDSARAPQGSYYHFPDYVADVADLVEQLVGRTPLLLAGHSMGGTIATLYTGAFPANVTKLALLEGVGPPDNSFEGMPDRMRTWIEQTRALEQQGGRVKSVGTLEDALRRLAKNHAGVPLDVLRSHLPELVTDAGDGHVGWKGDPRHKPASPVPFFAGAYLSFAKRVTCPVLYVSGGSTGFHSEDEEARLSAFSTLERFEIPDAGHMMHWTRTDPLAARLETFWKSTATA